MNSKVRIIKPADPKLLVKLKKPKAKPTKSKMSLDTARKITDYRLGKMLYNHFKED